eukprot:15455931-Alexandrium_andersonii.AAC.1
MVAELWSPPRLCHCVDAGTEHLGVPSNTKFSWVCGTAHVCVVRVVRCGACLRPWPTSIIALGMLWWLS